MATISEAKRAANRENAKKSTGPKTAEGKERSRANALKHGLSGAGVVRAEELEQVVQKRVEEWADALRPRTGPERWLVERAAVDSARVDDAVRCERARHAARIRNDALYSRTDELNEVHIRRLGKELMSGESDLPTLRLKLAATSAGCDWLIDRWEELARRQEAEGSWGWGMFDNAERLIGERHKDGSIGRRLATLMADYLTNLDAGWEQAPDPDLREIVSSRMGMIYRLEKYGWTMEELLAPRDLPDVPDSRRRAGDRLRRFIEREIADLRERRDRLAEIESLDAGEVPDRLLVDLSPEALLLNRYEQELHRRVHQSLREFDRLKKSREAEPEASCESPPEPLPQPAPPPPAPASRNEATAAPKSMPAAALPPVPPPLPSPFRDGGPAANGPMSIHMLPVAPHERR